MKFKNTISHPHDGHKPVISSNTFGYVNIDGSITSVFLEDDGFGNLVLYQTVAGEKLIVVQNFGSVDYVNGILTFIPSTLSALDGSIRIYAEISGNRIISSERFILVQDVNDGERALVTTFADDRPDRRILASASGSEFVGTSSISVNLASPTSSSSVVNTTSTRQSSTTDSGGSSSTPSGGGGY